MIFAQAKSGFEQVVRQKHTSHQLNDLPANSSEIDEGLAKKKKKIAALR